MYENAIIKLSPLCTKKNEKKNMFKTTQVNICNHSAGGSRVGKSRLL